MHSPIPPPIKQALDQGATVAISISGGKDSQAILRFVPQLLKWHGYYNTVFAIHADLGRMEWPQTAAHVERMCQQTKIPLVVVKRPQGDLLQQMQERMEKLKGQNKPHFPSSAARYCTSDQKRSQIDKELRKYDLIISVEGVRASESIARSKKPEWELRKQICTQTRTAYTWRPILHWSDNDVWTILGSSSNNIEMRRILYATGQHEAAFDGWQAHPAYVMGNERLSCAICVLASINDIKNGVKHNPELHQELVKMEIESGFSFRANLALKDLEPETPA